MGPKGAPPEVHVRPRDDDAESASGEGIDQAHHRVVQELGLVDRHDIGVAPYLARDLSGRVHRHGLDLTPIMGRDAIDPSVAVVQMGLEHLHGLPGNQGSSHATEELFRLATEHHSGDDFDPSDVRGHGLPGRGLPIRRAGPARNGSPAV